MPLWKDCSTLRSLGGHPIFSRTLNSPQRLTRSKAFVMAIKAMYSCSSWSWRRDKIKSIVERSYLKPPCNSGYTLPASVGDLFRAMQAKTCKDLHNYAEKSYSMVAASYCSPLCSYIEWRWCSHAYLVICPALAELVVQVTEKSTLSTLDDLRWHSIQSWNLSIWQSVDGLGRLINGWSFRPAPPVTGSCSIAFSAALRWCFPENTARRSVPLMYPFAFPLSLYDDTNCSFR